MTTGIISFKGNPNLFFNGRVRIVQQTIIDSDKPLKNGQPWYYEYRRDWVQLVELREPLPSPVNGSVEFISFNRNTRKALPPEKITFTIRLQ